MTEDTVSKTASAKPRRTRADRIMDVAADLMQRWGYKRVTMEDIADRAGIGKGTVYQHWKTREALFTAVLMREFIAAIEALLAEIRADPRSALLHQFSAKFFLFIMRRPILRAAYTVDLDTLGALAESEISKVLDLEQNRLMRDYLKALGEYGLLRSDLPLDELLYAYFSTLIGFFLIEPYNGEQFQFPLERKAEVLGAVIHQAFEIDAPPSEAVIQAAARRGSELLGELAQDYRAELAKAYE